MCPVLGIELDYEADGRTENNGIHLDRIDPKKGYVKGNVRAISRLANVIKQDVTDWRIFQAVADDMRRNEACTTE